MISTHTVQCVNNYKITPKFEMRTWEFWNKLNPCLIDYWLEMWEESLNLEEPSGLGREIQCCYKTQGLG